MDLRERLRLLRAAGATRPREGAADGMGTAAPLRPGAPAAVAPSAAPSVALSAAPPGGALQRTDGAVAPPLPALAGGCLEGYVKATPCGETFFVESRYPIAHCRGPLPLEAVFDLPGTAWELLARLPGNINLRQAVFFDTETTGLAGGSGTHAFLVGLGFFAGSDFVVRQYFLRDYPEEEALLEAVATDLAPCQLLVSFNGKAFDWPLMETRYRLSRRRPPLAGVPHLDLLHPSRRIWKERLLQCNLTNLESQVLGVVRQGDVPGSLIPQRYFDYLRTGQAQPLADVLLHNRLDIVSLVSLAGWLGRIVTDPLSPTPDGELVCGDDLFALGRLLVDRGALADGILCLEGARDRGVLAVSAARLQRELSAAYKRARAHEQALAVWQEMAAGQGALTLYPYVEMAKYYEHVAHDCEAAYRAARRALAVAERRRSLAGPAGAGALRDLEALQHRLARLERKLGRTPPRQAVHPSA